MTSLHPQPKRMILIIAVFITAGQLSMALYLPALPQLSTGLQLSASQAQATIAIYLLGYGLSQLVYGPLADRIGRRPTLLIGLLILIIGSAILIVGKSEQTLFIARLIQGIGGGSVSVLARAVLRDCFDGKELAVVMTIIMAIISLTPPLVQMLGAAISSKFGWHATFFAILVYNIVILAFVAVYFPETHTRRNSEKQSVLSNYLQLLRCRQYLCYTASIILVYSVMVLTLTDAPFIFQTTLGMTPVHYSLLLLLPALAYMSSSLLGKRLMQRFDCHQIMGFGIICLLVGGTILVGTHYFHSLNPATATAGIMFIFAAVGLIFPHAAARALQPFPLIAGTAAALAGCLQMAGSGLLSGLGNYLHLNTSLSLGLLLLAAAGLTAGLVYYLERDRIMQNAKGIPCPG